jgi:hypothetical protein
MNMSRSLANFGPWISTDRLLFSANVKWRRFCAQVRATNNSFFNNVFIAFPCSEFATQNDTECRFAVFALNTVEDYDVAVMEYRPLS